MLYISFWLVFELTSDKMELAALGRIKETDRSRELVLQLLDRGVGSILRGALILIGFDVTAEVKEGSGSERSHAVIWVSLTITLIIVLINRVTRSCIVYAVGKEKPAFHSYRERRLLLLLSLMYIGNYVAVQYLVHTPTLLSRSQESRLSFTPPAAPPSPPAAPSWDLLGLASSSPQLASGLVSSCLNSTDLATECAPLRQVYRDVSRMTELWSDAMHAIVTKLCGGEPRAGGCELTEWYAGNGLITQVFSLTMYDILFLVLNEVLYGLIWMTVSRFWGRNMTYAQSSINSYYDPPSFEFADRYAMVLKIAAMVLVFAPVAPALYFLGFLTLLWAQWVQEEALVTVYAKPRSLDHKVAERSRTILFALLLLHVCSSTVFYMRQAYVTGTEWSTEEQRPFQFSLILVVASFLIDLVFLRSFVRARLVGGVSDGEDRLWQDVCDEAGAWGALQEYRIPAPPLPAYGAKLRSVGNKVGISRSVTTAMRAVATSVAAAGAVEGAKEMV